MAYPTSPAPNDVQILGTRYEVDSLKAEDQTVHTRLKLDKRLTDWRLTYTCLATANIAILDAYFDTQRGYYQSDTWVHPSTGATHTIRVKSFSKTRSIGNVRYDFIVDLEEQP